jgi:leucyl/phenylalanyl-tRNA--protein transferase
MWYDFAGVTNKSRTHRFRPWLLPPGCTPIWPDPNLADPDEGLVAVGGDLTAGRLLSAYAQGIFPWYESDSTILWWCPEPRAILRAEDLHLSRSLRRRLRKSDFSLRCDTNFEGVIDGCAERAEGTWITPDMRAAYMHLHELGHAHSFEVWIDEELVGGLYGVQVGGLFAAESMFHRTTDASKIALVCAVTALFDAGFQLFDVQFMTPHLASLGVSLLTRKEYLRAVSNALDYRMPWQAVLRALKTSLPALLGVSLPHASQEG